jgi:hypothetical protein
MLTFTKATREQIKLRLALVGPSGSGKTWTALSIAENLGDRVALIDTEHGSAKKYADRFNFDSLELTSFSPNTYVEAIRAAAAAQYPVLIIDSLSHAWIGKDGALETVDRIAKKSPGGNSYVAWRDVTPMHNALVEAMLSYPGHLIVTMRAKTDYVMEEYTTQNGRKATRPVKVGLAPIQRDGVEYEFDIVADMNLENDLIVTKSRCSALSGQILSKPGKPLADTLIHWLNTGDSPSPILPTPLPVAATPVDELPDSRAAISSLLDTLGVVDTADRQRLVKKVLKSRKSDDLSPQELQEVLTGIREAHSIVPA